MVEAIRNHSFTKGNVSASIEGRILQDADRLDALGAVGIARVLTVRGCKKREFYQSNDPLSKNREQNDKKWGLDHFFNKLLVLEKYMNTKIGKIEAEKRTSVLKNYLYDLKKEM